MSRIAKAFNGKKAFIAFITGGDPDIETTERLIIAMAESGVDIVEIGIPFSDPIAEGIVIQKADERALKNGCTVDKLFDMVKRVRTKVEIPILFMTYINPVFVYGKDKFMTRSAEAGIDGIIVPDLPFEERGELAEVCDKYNVTLISMIAPTSGDRTEAIARDAKGFIYCVSSLGVTGVRSTISSDIAAVIERIRKVSSTPCAIGFGISTPEQAQEMAAISDGAIIGSAIVKIIEKFGRDSVEPVKQFVNEIKL
ncbi:MAG: tryptophan synthase subunit alpha [Deferribacteraceae bacterium]|jgi:tryptophan synthase alpha chain|nr:tryptophan synthase subunit alpha [Deferribacteraceae bacterium]